MMKRPIGRASPWLAVVLIISAGPGCDNVSWGGIDVTLREPPPARGAPADASRTLAEESPPPLPEGPVLYLVRRSGDSGSVVPVGEIAGDSLLPLPNEAEHPGFVDRFTSERLAPGTELVLVAGTARVGSLTVRVSTEADSSSCIVRPQAEGTLELVPALASGTRFLALGWEHGSARIHAAAPELDGDRDARAASLTLAGLTLNELRLPWPPSLPDIRRDFQTFPLERGDRPALAATFVYRDQLRVGPAPEGSYSLFILGEDQGGGYQTTFRRVRRADTEGKGAPRFLASADWNGDGRDGIVLEVLGERHRWLAALARGGDGWSVVFEDPCGEPPASAVASGG